MVELDKPRRRWVRPVLILSLALNVAFVGALAGFALTGGGHGKEARGPGGPDGMPYFRALSDADRQEMRAALRRDFRENRGSRGQVTEDYRAALEALRAEPFDRAALMAVLERQGARARERFQGGQRVMVDFVAGMTPEERSAYADRLSGQIDRLAERWDRLDRD